MINVCLLTSIKTTIFVRGCWSWLLWENTVHGLSEHNLSVLKSHGLIRFWHKVENNASNFRPACSTFKFSKCLDHVQCSCPANILQTARVKFATERRVNPWEYLGICIVDSNMLFHTEIECHRNHSWSECSKYFIVSKLKDHSHILMWTF